MGGGSKGKQYCKIIINNNPNPYMPTTQQTNENLNYLIRFGLRHFSGYKQT